MRPQGREPHRGGWRPSDGECSAGLQGESEGGRGPGDGVLGSCRWRPGGAGLQDWRWRVQWAAEGGVQCGEPAVMPRRLARGGSEEGMGSWRLAGDTREEGEKRRLEGTGRS